MSIQKLGTSLKANVADFDGNTSAIERTLQARMKLGFSDDEQRDSLSKLVIATHDVNKALDIQRTAMDLARLKGISLADASAALVKVEGGQFRALKALGIVLKDGATATDALAAVQKAAKGQAEEYANTNAGKLLVSQVKVGEAMEKFGAVTMPLVAEATSFAADKLTEFSGVADVVTGKTELTTHSISDLGRATTGQLPILGNIVNWALDFADSLDGTVKHVDTFAGKIEDDMTLSGGAIKTFANDWGSVKDDVMSSNKQIVRSFEDSVKLITDAINVLVDDGYDSVITHDRLMTDEHERNAVKRTLDTKKQNAEERLALRSRMHELDKAITEERIMLLEAGQLSAKEQAALLADLKTKLNASTGSAKAAIQSLINKIKEFGKITAPGVGIIVHAPGHGPLEFDEGGRVPGPVGAPVNAVVHGGEEVLTPQQAANYHYYLTVNGDIRARDEAGMLRTMQMMGRLAASPVG